MKLEYLSVLEISHEINKTQLDILKWEDARLYSINNGTWEILQEYYFKMVNMLNYRIGLLNVLLSKLLQN